MAEKFTRVLPKGGKSGDGWLSRGDVPAADAIAEIRAYADTLRRRVDLIDQTKDDEFSIAVVRGAVIEKFVRHVQQPKEPQ